jgi:hypothetical protein
MRLFRLMLGASCAAALSGLLGAQDLQPIQAPELHGTVGGMIDELARARGTGTGVKPKVVTADVASAAFLFPSAGSVQGAGGTFFKSDGMIVNYRNSAQRVSMGWIAQGVNNGSRPLKYFNLNAVTPYTLEDFVATSLGESGLGAVLVTGVLQSGNPDTNASLDGFSRIWTPQPGSAGTVSLAFPSIAVLDSFGNAFAYALGLRHDAGFRTNVGIVNLDSQPHTFNVTANGKTQLINNFTVNVEAYSMRQVPITAGNYGILLISVSPTVNGFWWSAYAAAVDNTTGDGWVAHAAQP